MRATQRRVLDFINQFTAKHGYSPTMQEIGDAIGLKSKSTVHRHIHALADLGYLTLDETKPRTIVTGEGSVMVGKSRYEALERLYEVVKQRDDVLWWKESDERIYASNDDIEAILNELEALSDVTRCLD